jgi:hypothetical protein
MPAYRTVGNAELCNLCRWYLDVNKNKETEKENGEGKKERY